ncbi:hypothetical protein Bca52824_008331 [Brassica carinata]|uniref:Uncharacterized protein n=1 Tax=Brassica carinata TaxID=52824 RepID=A0A8X7WBS6_BRACI|nr:hypothetical protein Bca52824_008331 [Brassica carinata]
MTEESHVSSVDSTKVAARGRKKQIVQSWNWTYQLSKGKSFAKPELKACIEEFEEKLNKFHMEKQRTRRNRKKRSGSYRESQEHGTSCCPPSI